MTPEFLESYFGLGKGNNLSETILKSSYQVGPFVFLQCFLGNAIVAIAQKEGKTWTEASKDFYSSGQFTESLKLSIKLYAASLGGTAGNNFFRTFSASPRGKMLFGALGEGLGSATTFMLTSVAMTAFSEIKEKFANRLYGKTDKENMLGFIKKLSEDVALFPNTFVEGVVLSLVSDLDIAKKLIAYFRIKDSDTFQQFIVHGRSAGITGAIASLSFAFPGEVIPSGAQYVYQKFGLFTPYEKKIRDIMIKHPEMMEHPDTLKYRGHK